MMKKTIQHFISLAILLVSFTINAQTQNWIGDLYPKDFQKFENGGYITVVGNVIIANSKLINLKKLKNLHVVTGDFKIGIYNSSTDTYNGNLYLQSLKGLENLKTITGKFTIRNNKVLNNIKSLHNLSQVKDVFIAFNPQLETFDGLQNFTTLDKLTVYKNKRLYDITALSGITMLNQLRITYNLSLTNLEGLQNIKKINGSLTIKSNDYLTNIKGLRGLTEVSGKIIIYANPRLRTLEGLNMTEIKNDFKIWYNHSLVNLKGLEKIEKIYGKIYIYGNNTLKNLEGLKNVSFINYLEIVSNNKLENTEGFYNLEKIGTLEIRTNSNLVRLANFDKLKKINVFALTRNKSIKELIGFTSVEKLLILDIYHNENLRQITIFNNVDDVQNVDISYNENLENLTCLNKIDTIGSSLLLEKNRSIKTINSFNKLKKIAKDFKIKENTHLESIENFKNLNYVGKIVEIYDNRNLKTLKGLEKLEYVGEKLKIYDNNNLDDFSSLSYNLLSSLEKDNITIIRNKEDDIEIDKLIENATFRTLMTREFLKDKSKHKLYLMRNEILARKGYIFKDEELKKLFQSKKWYKPNNTGKIKLSEIDNKNSKLIASIEKEIADCAIKLVPIIKNKFKNEAVFANEYKEYQSKIIEFIKTIDIDTILKSSRLSYRKNYFLHTDENNNYIEKDRVEDSIYVFFGESKNVFSILIVNNFVYEFSGEIGRKLIIFDFMIKEDCSFEYNKDSRKIN